MTSLALQLKKLAVPQSKIVLGGKAERASLLFDKRDAADLEFKTVHDLGK